VSEQGIDTLAREQLSLKTELASIKDSLNQKANPTEQEQEDLHTIQEFLDHQESCDKPDCEIHQAKEDLSKTWFLKGITIGKRL
jgi:hypothetical protein